MRSLFIHLFWYINLNTIENNVNLNILAENATVLTRSNSSGELKSLRFKKNDMCPNALGNVIPTRRDGKDYNGIVAIVYPFAIDVCIPSTKIECIILAHTHKNH